MLWELSGDGWHGHRYERTRAASSCLWLDGRDGNSSGAFEATLPADQPFDRIVVSLNTAFQQDCVQIRVRVRALVEGAWTPWAPIGVYPGSFSEDEILPKTEIGPDPAQVEVRLDEARFPRSATRAALRLEFEVDRERLARMRAAFGGGTRVEDPTVVAWIFRTAVLTWLHGHHGPEAPSREHPAWGRVLSLPRVAAGRGLAWPGAIATVLGLEGHAEDADVKDLAERVFDHGAGMAATPSFFMAFVSATYEWGATCARFDGLGPLEDQLAAGRPAIVAVSPADPSPLPLVVCGFTADGDVVVRDPLAGGIEVVVARAELARRWLGDGDGLAWTFVPF